MSIEKVIIAGGGIGGLTAAASLLQAGVDVEIYEQASQLGEVGAGIQVSANASRVYQHLGLLDRLVDCGYRPDEYRFRVYDEGDVLQHIPLGNQYEQRHDVPYISVHRADLHRILVDRVRELKKDAIHLCAEAAEFVEDEHGITLHFTNREPAHGDLLIGADGIKSSIRKQIAGDTPVNYTGDASWRIIVPMNDLPQEHRQTSVDIWVGPGKHAVTYPLRGGELLNLVGCVEHEEWDDESWVAVAPWEEMVRDFADWHPTIQEIIQHADRDKCYRWAMNNRAPIRNWSTQRATLLGDAAHPTLPYMAQGAAMAVEDAAVLARAVQMESDATAAIDLYQRNRVDRTARIVNESSANRDLFHLDSTQALRDAFAKRDMNAERSAWLFSYDPVNVPLM
ncbi:monooxygenase [Natronospirillum operosum]|uniref:Monooxygenase n=1 Tax=Natronospirillum operosum TaxID=2759953 RepID=A0A4Z0WH89_9GAMM|nr:FAD-dependent monooxygenase [Natronospirillum operosum]TGG95051.1 monooxygenase [Natronospirillum operosum]